MSILDSGWSELCVAGVLVVGLLLLLLEYSVAWLRQRRVRRELASRAVEEFQRGQAQRWRLRGPAAPAYWLAEAFHPDEASHRLRPQLAAGDDGTEEICRIPPPGYSQPGDRSLVLHIQGEKSRDETIEIH